MNNLNSLGPVGIGAIMVLVGLAIWRIKALSGTVWVVIQWLLVIGGALLLIQGTIGFSSVVLVIGTALRWIGIFFSAIGGALTKAGDAVLSI